MDRGEIPFLVEVIIISVLAKKSFLYRFKHRCNFLIDELLLAELVSFGQNQ